LPLAFALRCATDVASALRELHREGSAHGVVTPDLILVRAFGATLLLPEGAASQLDPRVDIRDFGAVLFEILTGSKPTPGAAPLCVPQPVPHSTPAGLRAAAIALATRCLATVPEARPPMQKVATEVRLLAIMARQHENVLLPLPPHSLVPAAPKNSSSIASPTVAPLPPAPVIEPASPASLPPPPDEPAVLTMLTCPECSSASVRHSRAQSDFEELLGRFRHPMLRCHRCYFRYFLLFGIVFSKETPA
jgi:hypothetical protein